MIFTRTHIPDVLVIEPKIHGDHRGYFVESFRQDLFEDFTGEKINFCQDNESKSSFGVLRGLHYQLPPFSQAKLVKVVSGRVLDVAVDIRTDSPTFGQHVSVELSSQNNKQLFVPRGFAHGFVVLSKEAIFSYKCDNYYNKDHDRGIAYNDVELNIDWQLEASMLKLSDRDLGHPQLNQVESFTNLEFAHG